MDYEKKYKEALETARKINSGEGVAAPPDWTVYEVIFPELKESEDEKIRKAIIAHIKDLHYYDIYYGVTPDEMVAWLEKQNPVKFNDEKDERIRKELLESFKYQQRESRTDKEWLNGIKLSEVVAWLEKQGQTFPILSNSSNTEKKWTEEDENNLNMVIYFMRSENTPYSPTDVEPVVEWLCGLKQRMEE